MSNDDVDGWIAQLMQCKPLSENEVKKLCDKVSCCLFVVGMYALRCVYRGGVETGEDGWRTSRYTARDIPQAVVTGGRRESSTHLSYTARLPVISIGQS